MFVVPQTRQTCSLEFSPVSNVIVCVKCDVPLSSSFLSLLKSKKGSKCVSDFPIAVHTTIILT